MNKSVDHRSIRFGVVVVAATLVFAAGCGSDSGDVETRSEPTDVTASIVDDTSTTVWDDPDQLPMLTVDAFGGFRPAGVDFADVPGLTVYPDGRAIIHGPQVAIYPGPTLPNLLVPTLSAEQLNALKDLAREAGLLATAPDYGHPPIADGATTQVTLRVDGKTYVHEAYALADLALPGGSTSKPAVTDDVSRVRANLVGFVDAATDLAGGGITIEYKPDAFAIRALKGPAAHEDPSPDPGEVETPVRPWPVPEVDLQSADECLLVKGDTAKTLHTALADTKELTRFEQDGKIYNIAIRPLLPHEHSCADLT